MSMIVAAIQMCSSHEITENLTVAERLITKAAQEGAKLIVLPEMFAIMGLNPNDKIDFKEAFGHGQIQDFLSAQAKKHHVWIVGGTIPIESETNKKKIKAASLIFNDEGICVARYDKMHLFDVTLSEREFYRESDTTEPGDNTVVIETPIGKLGMAVCYDVRFPELFRSLSDKGAEIIVLPSAFTVPTGTAHWEVLTRSRAIENFCYLVGACQGGTHSNGRKTFGHSLIVGPWGEILSRQDNTRPGVIYATIDLKKIEEAKKAIPIHNHRRHDLFSRTPIKSTKPTNLV